MSGQLERLLAQATPDVKPSGAVAISAMQRARWKLEELAPDLARLLVDAMAQLAVENEKHPNHNITNLLAWFAELEQKAGEGQA